MQFMHVSHKGKFATQSRKADLRQRTDPALLWVLVLAAAAIRLFLMFWFRAYIFESSWSFGYETGRIASSIASGTGFSSPFIEPSGPTAWLAPVYPGFVAVLFKLLGIYTKEAIVVAIVCNCLFSAATCLPLYYIAATIFSRSVGWMAAILFAFYPPSIWHATNTVWDTTLFTLLSMCLILWLIRISEVFNEKRAVFLGLFMGFLALVNPVILAYYPFALGWIYLKRAACNRNPYRLLVLVTFCTAVSISPWIIRNYVVFKRLMLRSDFGVELKIGNSQAAWNALKDGHTTGLSMHPTNSHDEMAAFLQWGEIDYSRRCFDDALQFIRNNPDKFFYMTLTRVSQFWLGTINEWKGNLRLGFSVSAIKRFCHLLPLPFMVAGAIFALRNRLTVFPIFAFLLLIPVVYYVTHVAERYRFPIEPTILVLASGGLYWFTLGIWKSPKMT
jgi:4-amino-4-deoxy-L-arabinose transferase-like glycosyltransferase